MIPEEQEKSYQYFPLGVGANMTIGKTSVTVKKQRTSKNGYTESWWDVRHECVSVFFIRAIFSIFLEQSSVQFRSN